MEETITSLAATAYSNYIGTESTEPDFRSTIQQITTGNKPAKKETMLHGWVQNMRGSVNNTFKWCGLLDSLSEKEPDYAVISETTKDNDPTQLLFLHLDACAKRTQTTKTAPPSERTYLTQFSLTTLMQRGKKEE